jgi:hypothetical protein
MPREDISRMGGRLELESSYHGHSMIQIIAGGIVKKEGTLISVIKGAI